MATTITVETIQFKRGKAADWVSANPLLLIGEPGYESDTHKLKIGDGLRKWNSLPYVNEVEALIASATQLGSVLSSSAKNEIAVGADGKMSVNEIGVEKLSNTDDVRLILNGGNA